MTAAIQVRWPRAALELPARSLRTRAANLGRCFRSHAGLPPGRPVVASRRVDRPTALNNALAREKGSLIHSCRLLNYSNMGLRIPHGVIPPAARFHSRILTGFGRLLPSLFISPRLRTGSAGASPSREDWLGRR